MGRPPGSKNKNNLPKPVTPIKPVKPKEEKEEPEDEVYLEGKLCISLFGDKTVYIDVIDPVKVPTFVKIIKALEEEGYDTLLTEEPE